jgi:class 3 adenylate cyclase
MEQGDHRLAAVLMADIDRFGQMLERDEAKALGRHREVSSILRTCSETHRGTVVKSGGNSWLVDFKTALDAVKCAASLQEAASASLSADSVPPVSLRIGIHLGDTYFYENDAMGEGISIAAKLREACRPGGICISSDVYHQVFQKLSLPFRNLGTVKIPDIAREVQAFEIVPAGASAAGEKAREESGGSAGMNAFARGGESAAQPPPIDFEDLKQLLKDTVRYAGKRFEEEILTKNASYRNSPDRQHGTYGPHHPAPPPPPVFPEDWKEYRHERRRELRHILREERRGKTPTHRSVGYDTYRKRIEQEAAHAKSSLRAHLIPFSAVSGFLLVLNLLTSASFPWFFFPVGGWGIGVLTHWASVREAERRRKDLERLPRLSDEQTSLIRHIHRIRQRFSGHLAATLSVSGFLAMVNIITSPSYPWFLFPAAALGLGLAIHWGGFSGNRKELNKRLQESLAAGPPPDAAGTREGEPDPDENPAVAEAWRLKQGILKKAEEIGDPALLEEMKTVLPDYIEQIRSLARKEREVKDLLGSIPITEMERDRARMVSRLEESADEGMKREYTKSIAELDRQLESFRSLNERSELLTLKVQSSVNSLRKLQADLIKIPETKSKAPYTLNSLKKRADELGDYLSDLERGYRELEE